MVGSVSKVMKGRRRSARRVIEAVVLAICISESRPSHARAARGGDADEGQALLEGRTRTAHEALADHRTHRAAEEFELEAGDHHRRS